MFQWFKSKCQTTLTHEQVQQKIVVVPVLQTGHQLDFIYKVEREVVSCLFDCSLVLQPGESIKEVTYENGDISVSLTDFVYASTQFTVNIQGGWDNCKSTLLLKIETNTQQAYTFTFLITVISSFKKKTDIEKAQRACCLWVLDRNPELNYIQPNQEPWVEGDMVLNMNNRYLWEYRKTDQKNSWIPLFIMNGSIEPVNTPYSDAQNPGERIVLNHINADQGKIKSNAKGNLSITGEVTTNSIYTKSIVAGHPLGEGMLFTTPGMIAGHSLYIGSPEAKPKNIYIGMPGVVSTKLIAADYLQITPLSTRELPVHVTKGTLILCHDYSGSSELVLLYATKDNPQSVSDWKPLFSSLSVEDHDKPPRPKSRPHLYPISFNPNIPDKSSFGKIVPMKPMIVPNKTDEIVADKPSSTKQEEKHLGTDTYVSLQFERENVPVSKDKTTVWKHLSVKNIDQQLRGAGKQYWSEENNHWEAPKSGLLHIQGWFLFTEEQLNISEPIAYHAGDILLVNLCCNKDRHQDIYPITQLEFPLLPYMNDVTHRVCPNQKLTFTISYPVEAGDKITFEVAYNPQHSVYGQAKELSLKKTMITLFMS